MFKSQNFCHIASNNRNLVKVGVFTYRTTDSLETVLTSGYFNERIIDINLHDLIIHEKISAIDSTVVERNILCVVERTLDNVGTVLIQSDWEKGIDQTIEDILDQLETFVKIDGSSVMTGNLQTPNVRLTGKGGITAKVGSSDINLVKLNNDSALGKVEVGQGNVPTQVSSATFTHKLAGVDYKVLDNNDTATPVSDTNKVITQAEEQVLDSKIDTAANSGDQLYSTGVWYAKMYAGTTPPASVEGRNYADFSQTDGSGNPVIKIYTYTSGSWTLTDTIVPPTEYNGYMTITSKIWDISEQAGQQGGKVLWSHNQRTFTPYPQIISFDGANITNGSFQGVATLSNISTAPTPTDASPNTQIATKEYVDTHSSSGGAGRNIGDIFYTTRTDTALAGAVECDGGTYNTEDYEGEGSIGELLEAGKLDYISLTDYATAISTKGWCDKIGWNGTGTTSFRVPTLTPHIVQKNNIPVKTGTEHVDSTIAKTLDPLKFRKQSDGGYSSAVLTTNSTGELGGQSGVQTQTVKLTPTNLIADTSDTAQLRVMIQLFNSTTDEAVATVGTVVAQVGTLNTRTDGMIDYVVENQLPTAENDYTWYRKYKSGWVEQGGIYNPAFTGTKTFAYPVEMADTNYTLTTGTGCSNVSNMHGKDYITAKTTTGFSFTSVSLAGSFTTSLFNWQVSGMAAN